MLNNQLESLNIYVCMDIAIKLLRHVHVASMNKYQYHFTFCNFRGEPKCWYGVPGNKANAFEEVFYFILIFLSLLKLSVSLFLICLPLND